MLYCTLFVLYMDSTEKSLMCKVFASYEFLLHGFFKTNFATLNFARTQGTCSNALMAQVWKICTTNSIYLFISAKPKS